MVFFRLSRLERGDKDKDKEEEDGGTAGLLSNPAPIGGSSASASSGADRLRDDLGGLGKDKKKKPKDADSIGASAPSGAERAGSGVPARAQAGLSVNDFISKTKNQQRQGLKPSGPELIAYARYLGIDPVADHDLLWIAVEALEAPLPSDWTEHFDSNDRVFYYNATTRVSSWTHPLEHTYRETYKTIVNFRNANLSPEERGRKLHELQMEVKQMEADVHREISQWSEHTDEQNNRFYFNREGRQSTWTDPRPAKCQILYLRIKMLGLLHGAHPGGTGGFGDGKGDSKFDMGTGMSRFGSLPGSEFDDPANKRKVGGAGDEAGGAGRRSPSVDSDNSDSDGDRDGDKKKKRKKNKKKKNRGQEPDAAPPVRLGVPQKLGSSQSEPSVGGKMGKERDSDPGGMARSPRGGGGMQATPSGPQALRDTFDQGEGLTSHGRARVKAGIRLEPMASIKLEPIAASPPAGSGNGGGNSPPAERGVKVGASASVPAL
uniref:WW domain-containing protein n=1 Tax=Strombidinopsis acuminata TaxID=141414 RepID=A0A7S3RBJ9_9SPIT|mmetsp:Transcript_93489/g.241611  ORF Transcript_93489/g.241611 Transcript_93489/m.241611 type:complete len:490 (-) Transcript_93489:126-1595(-)